MIYYDIVRGAMIYCDILWHIMIYYDRWRSCYITYCIYYDIVVWLFILWTHTYLFIGTRWGKLIYRCGKSIVFRSKHDRLIHGGASTISPVISPRNQRIYLKYYGQVSRIEPSLWLSGYISYITMMTMMSCIMDIYISIYLYHLVI
jgi:hypothetical protein